MTKIAVPRLGVNIDHVATIRNARGGKHPDPLRAARLAVEAGADGITAHLRGDRRHIRDHDMELLCREIGKPINMEMGATEEMLDIACRLKPHAVCLVPEGRQELTTESGLNILGGLNHLRQATDRLKAAGIRVSLFSDPERIQIESAVKVGADVVELHTGTYVEAVSESDLVASESELDRLVEAAALADELGLEVHAGHGLDYDTVEAVAAIPQIVELNIGHFLVGEAVFEGLDGAVKSMRRFIARARGLPDL